MIEGKIEAPINNKQFVVACLICGEQKPVMLYPHKKSGFIVGWIFVCGEHEKDAQGLYCDFQKLKPVQLSEAISHA